LKDKIQGNDAKILIPGCGNSLFSEKIATEMKQNHVISQDYEEKVIKRMQERTTNFKISGVTYEVQDCTKMTT
jgi:ubiquinone/menaquinone biosynthesis C-methylase UbiE